MSSSGQIKRKALLNMLKKCAPGFKIQDGEHNDTVFWRDKRFDGLPKGEHGKGRQSGRVEIEIGHVKQLVSQLEIEPECAQKVLGFPFRKRTCRCESRQHLEHLDTSCSERATKRGGYCDACHAHAANEL